MAVLDGKYEILSERALEPGESLFTATAPDGRTLRIAWFELRDPQQEAQFESYRQLLRQLRRENLAALHDIVSRPGAHYVAWHAAGGLPKAPVDARLRGLLERFGYTPEQADVRLGPGGAQLYGLAFGQARLPSEPAPPAPKPPPRPGLLRRLSDGALAWVLGGVLALAAAAIFALAFQLSLTPLVAVPDLGDQDVNQAAQALYQARLGTALRAVPSSAAPYTVTGLEPEPGTLLRQGQTVTINYALPPGQLELTEVPQLRGLSDTGELQARLEAARLRLGAVAYIYANAPADLVMAQSHPAQSRVEENTAVAVLISLGPEPRETFVPELLGMSYDEARYWADLAGLEVAPPEYQAAPGLVPGTVVAQSIPPYTPVPLAGTLLRLTLAGAGAAEGAPSTPSFIGLSEQEARRLAERAGLSLESEWLENPLESLNLPEGVIDQSPAPGESASGSVTLLLNAHPLAIPRPPVTASVKALEERVLEYAFQVEPGLGTLSARITATTLSGLEYPVLTGKTVRGGDRLSGSWRTREPGPVTFTLYLGSAVYQQEQRND